MWLLITFITIWALSPGPVAVMTLHEARKKGTMAGVAVSAGATVTSALMVMMGLVVHLVGFSSILESDSTIIIERIGALSIIAMGMYAGYKSILSTFEQENSDVADVQPIGNFGFVQGMMVMATYIPQALVYYNLLIPQTLEPQAV
ncbi:MAG: LysE family transporter, partial [Chloroflexota bacterium]